MDGGVRGETRVKNVEVLQPSVTPVSRATQVQHSLDARNPQLFHGVTGENEACVAPMCCTGVAPLLRAATPLLIRQVSDFTTFQLFTGKKVLHGCVGFPILSIYKLVIGPNK